ncbi:MAG: hypothetical protein J6X28_03405 [Bacilli bacterium]|nr:hypothetical protein [Bacilli bacterium]
MVSGGTVQGDCSSLSSCLSSFASEVGGLSGSWMGSSFDSINRQVSACSEEFNGVISKEMEAFASACDLYVQYDTCKKSLEAAKSHYNSAVANQDSASVSSYGNQVANLGSQLNQLKSQIEVLLSSASSGALTATPLSGVSSSDALSALGSPSWGSFQAYEYTAQNGLTVKYYLYVPDYGTENVSGLPVMMYMHGGGDDNSYSNLLERGLSKQLKNQAVNPEGIVIIPFIQSFSNNKTIPALKDLVDHVVEEYNADPDRVSLSGHSYGAKTCYRLVNAYPDSFSAIVPISGYDKLSDAFKNVKVWAFTGEYDHGADTKKLMEQIQAMGGTASCHIYDHKGHSYVQDYTYEDEYTSPEGEEISPLTWAFQQVREKTTA